MFSRKIHALRSSFFQAVVSPTSPPGSLCVGLVSAAPKRKKGLLGVSPGEAGRRRRQEDRGHQPGRHARGTLRPGALEGKSTGCAACLKAVLRVITKLENYVGATQLQDGWVLYAVYLICGKMGTAVVKWKSSPCASTYVVCLEAVVWKRQRRFLAAQHLFG